MKLTSTSTLILTALVAGISASTLEAKSEDTACCLSATTCPPTGETETEFFRRGPKGFVSEVTGLISREDLVCCCSAPLASDCEECFP